MSEIITIAGGNSSLEVNRTAKGDYTWALKLYFMGHDMRSIKNVIENVAKTRNILETVLGQKVIPTEEMSSYMERLLETAEKAVRDAEGEV